MMNSRFIKKAAAFFSGLGLFLFTLILSLSLALNTNDARQLIFNQLNSFLPGTFFVDHLHVSLLSGTLDARGLGLDAPDGKPMVRVNRLYVNISILSLVMRTLSIEEALIDEPRVFLETDGQGRLNFVTLFGAGDTEPPSNDTSEFDIPWNVKLASLDLKQGLVSYQASGEEMALAENLAIQTDHVNVKKGSGHFSMDMGPCHIRVNNQSIRFTRLAASGGLDRERLSLMSFHLSSDMGDLSAKGTISDVFTHPKLDLSLIMNGSLTDLDRVLGLSLGMSGESRLELSLRGDLDNPDADVRLMGQDLSVMGQALNSLELAANLHDRRVNISRMTVGAASGTASLSGRIDVSTAFADGFVNSDFKAREILYSLQLDSAFPRVESLAVLAGIVNGPMAVRINLDGKGIFPDHIEARATVTADSERLALWNTPVAPYHLDGEVTYEPGVLSVLSSQLDSLGNRLMLHGNYRIIDNAWKGGLNLRSDDLSRIALISPYVKAAGSLDIDSRWSGTGGTWEALFQGRGKTLSYEGIPLGDVTTDVALGSQGILTVSSLAMKQGESTLTGGGAMGLFDQRQALDLSFSFNHLDVAHLFDQKNMNAVADGRLHIGGTLASPRAKAHISSRDLAWDTLHLGDLDVSAGFDQGRVSVSALKLSNGPSVIDAHGEIQVLSPDLTLLSEPVVDISLTSDSLFLQDFYPQVKGTVALDTHVTGRFGHLAGAGHLTAQALDLGVQAVDTLEVDVHLDGDALVVDRADVTLAKNETIRMDGRLSLGDKDYDVNVSSTEVSIKHLGRLGQQLDCDGKVLVNVNGRGNLANPGLSGTLELKDVRLNQEPLEGGVVNLELSDRVARVSGDLIVNIDTQIHLDTYEFTARARLDRTELSPFFRIAGYGELNGTVTGRIDAGGRLDDLETIRVNAEMSSLTIRSGNMPLIRSDAIALMYDRTGLTFPETHFVLLDKGDLTVTGLGWLNGKLDVVAQGTIPLEVIDPFVEELNTMSGLIQVSASLKGRVDEPELQGQVTLESLSFLIPELMQTVHDVNGTLRVTPREITLEALTGGLDSGNFNIRGSLGLDHLKPGDLALEIIGDALPISLPDIMDMSVNTRMTVTGTPDNTQLKGTLMLLEGKYYKDVSMNLITMVGMVGEKTRDETTALPAVTAPYLRGMTLDLNLRHRNPFVVDNNISLLELKPDVRVYGTLNHPLISGRAQIGEGVITYQGKEFEVKKGVVDFLNPYKIEPTLDVECQTEIRTWTLTLSVSGTPDNMKFNLTSNPSESDGDILSILLFGKTTRELRSGGSDSSVPAAQLLSDAISMNLEKSIKDATGMDTVEVDYANAGAQGSENGVRVTIGKELSERLTIKYGVESKNAEAVQRAVSEYKFFENLMINAYQDTANDFGAELVYRIEFR